VDINTTLSYAGETAAGTGMVLTSSGEVLTNNHVIDGATTISVTDIGNGRTYGATVVGYDRTGDIAVLQLRGASGLHTVSIGDSSKVTVGESIVAIGNAEGVGGTPTAAGGSVTALDQPITASDEGGGNSEQLTGLIEVDADVVPGDSGGPLVNGSDDVVGIDTAAASGASFSSATSDGYAIPINEALSIARKITSGSSSSTVHIGPTALLGVDVVSTSSNDSLGATEVDQCPVNPTTVSGALVCDTPSGTPAAQAGLAAGDVITSLGGQNVGSAPALTTAIGAHAPGDKVPVSWVDTSGQQHTATVQLASGPPA
jgi:S1-C subfamily serine protease